MTLRTKEAIKLLKDMLEPIQIKLPNGTFEPYEAAFVGPIPRKRLRQVLDLLSPPKPKEVTNGNQSDSTPPSDSGPH